MDEVVINSNLASRAWEWIRNRGGLAVWRSINLSNPGAIWYTPVLTEDEKPYEKPSWQSESVPTRIILRPQDLIVCVFEEFKRFHVALRVSGNGLMRKCTRGSSDRIYRALAKAGEDSYYRLDDQTQEAVIYKPGFRCNLLEWYNTYQKEGKNG